MTNPSDETAEDGGSCAPLGGSVTVVEMSGNETDEQCKDIAWQMFCNAHPVEAHQHNPDGFWKYFHARAQDMTREQMGYDVQSMWQEIRNTVLFITHSIAEAVFLADRVLVMSPRPGEVVRDLRIDLERPRSSDTHSDPRFAEYTREIRHIFEQKGVLSAH